MKDRYFIVQPRCDTKRLRQALFEAKGHVVLQYPDGRILVNVKQHGTHFQRYMDMHATPYTTTGSMRR